MMEELGWKPLHERKREQRLFLLYKIVNDLVAIHADQHITYNNRRSRHGHNKQLKIKSANSEVYRTSFSQEIFLRLEHIATQCYRLLHDR